MKLSDYHKTYYEFSGKASDIARQLAFAGIAVIWLFKIESDSGIGIPADLIWASIMLAGSLSADLTQYLVGSAIWKSYYRRFEASGARDDDEVPEHHIWVERPIAFFFWIKIGQLFLGYLLMIQFLIKQTIPN